MAERVNNCIQLLLLVVLVALVGRSCSADDELRPEVQVASNGTEAEAETMDLYGPELDDNELRTLMPMTILGTDDMSPMVDSTEPGMVENNAEPEEWKIPEHKMDLVRFFNGRFYGVQYNKINDLLVDEVESPQLEANFAVMTQWLAREREKGIGLFNRATVEALQQLIELYKLKDKELCNRDAYAIIFKNDQATSGRVHKPLSMLQPMRRVDALVYQLFMGHAIECFHKYPKNYAKKRASMNQEVRRRVETFLDMVLGDPLAVKSKVNVLNKKAVGQIAYKFLMVNAPDDRLEHYLGKVIDEKSGKLVVDEQKVRDLINKYIVQPCKSYSQEMGPDVFLPARFDARMFLPEDRYQPHNRPLSEFLHGFVHFTLCEKLIKRDEPYVTKKVVQHIYSLY